MKLLIPLIVIAIALYAALVFWLSTRLGRSIKTLGSAPVNTKQMLDSTANRKYGSR